MKAMLGAFTSSRARERFGAEVAAQLDSAVRHYGRCLQTDSARIALPRRLDLGPDTPLVEFDAELSPFSAALLEHESHRLGVDRQIVLNHAVILYLADLDRRAVRR